jgi:MFS family permease
MAALPVGRDTLGEPESTGTETGPRRRLLRLPSTFSSLRHRNYRLFFFGQMISLVGTWMQWAAQGWLVLELSNRYDVMGYVRTAQTLPLAVLSLFGGVLADRFRRRNILIVTQSAAVLPPLLLALLVFTDVVEVWHIAVLASLSGVVAAFDMPTRQAFVIKMVNRKDLMNAIALNSSLFNSARIFGPLVAGALMHWVGAAYCFTANGLSFLAVVIALVMIRVAESPNRKQGESIQRRIIAGFSYVRSDKRILGLFGIMAIVGIFGFSYMVLMPAFARDVFKRGPLGYGELLAFNGIGALVGALFVATVAKKVRKKRRLLLEGVLIFCVSITVFSSTSVMTVARVSLIFAGAGMIMFFTTANTLVQSVVPEEFRGRVMGIFAFVFGGTMPIGSILFGIAAQHVGLGLTVQTGAAVCAVLTVVAYTVGKRVGAPPPRAEAPDRIEPQIPY